MSARKPIFLSFFPLNSQKFEFTVYRRLYEYGDTKDKFTTHGRFNLPRNSFTDGQQDDNYTSYWVGFEYSQGFEEMTCDRRINNNLTLEYLYRRLKKKCEQVLSSDEYVLNEGKEFSRRRINFVMCQYNDGKQTVWLEPYFLKSKRLFGFLVDFKFLNESDGEQSIKVLKLSLSLDKHGRRNKNFYIDRYDQIQKFVAKHKETVFDLAPDVSICPDMCHLDVNTLNTKSYVFANSGAKKSQFRGIKEHGPLSPVNDGTKVYFIFREKDRLFSYDLFRALRGDTFPNTFPGMEVMFRYRFDGSNVGGIPIEDFTFENLQDAIQDIRRAANGCPVVPIFISPFDKFNADDTDREVYYKIKHFCLQNSIPSQFVGNPLLRRQKYQFKWATSNIALQIFAKMGGQPWKLEPETKKCLIVGIGQAHNKEQGIIKKYFAYSILTESTGLYKELKILGDTHKSEQYIEDFKHNLKRVFDEYYSNYDSFVVHTTFKIRRDELEAVQQVIESMSLDDSAKKDFVVMKFNDWNKFFGYSSESNSMIPYESSYIRLSYNEYLVWFEGLQYHNPNAGRKIERPLHVEFIFANRELDDVRKRDYLQDALNISGANWRGFNAKSLPISVHYAYLVARYYKEFQKLGLEEVNLEAIKPWFL